MPVSPSRLSRVWRCNVPAQPEKPAYAASLQRRYRQSLRRDIASCGESWKIAGQFSVRGRLAADVLENDAQ